MKWILLIFIFFAPTITHASTSPVQHNTGSHQFHVMVDDLEETMASLRSLPIFELSSNANMQHGHGHITFDINTAYMPQVIATLEELGNITNSQGSASSALSRLADLRTDLAVRTDEHARLMELHSQATTVDVMIRIENRLVGVISNMELLQGDINNIESRLGITSVDVMIGVVIDRLYEPMSDYTFWQELRAAFVGSAVWSALFVQNAMIALSYSIVPVVIVALGIVAYRMYKKRGGIGNADIKEE